jgi:hypothetical protein
MQFGALCGLLGAVATGAFGIWLVACAWVFTMVVIGAMRAPFKPALQHALRLRPPQGPLMWTGYLIAVWLAGAMVK